MGLIASLCNYIGPTFASSSPPSKLPLDADVTIRWAGFPAGIRAPVSIALVHTPSGSIRQNISISTNVTGLPHSPSHSALPFL